MHFQHLHDAKVGSKVGTWSALEWGGWPGRSRESSNSVLGLRIMTTLPVGLASAASGSGFSHKSEGEVYVSLRDMEPLTKCFDQWLVVFCASLGVTAYIS